MIKKKTYHRSQNPGENGIKVYHTDGLTHGNNLGYKK